MLCADFAFQIQLPPYRNLVDILVVPTDQPGVGEHLQSFPNPSVRTIAVFEVRILSDYQRLRPASLVELFEKRLRLTLVAFVKLHRVEWRVLEVGPHILTDGFAVDTLRLQFLQYVRNQGTNDRFELVDGPSEVRLAF